MISIMKDLRKILYLFVVTLLLSSCAKKQYVHVADIDTDYIRVNKYSAKEDKTVKDMIAPYKEQLDAEMNVVLGVIAEDMIKSKPNSNLGNWFADLLQSIANIEFDGYIDFATQNYGGLRVPVVAKGDLTVGDIYEVMPFDNKLVILNLSGEKTLLLLNRIAEYGGWPISSNLTFSIEDDKATNIMIKGEPFDVRKTYRVALPDYTANGGDNCDFLKEEPQEDNDKMIRDLIVEYFENNPPTEPIVAPVGKRIK